MDAAERELFTASLRRATEAHTGGALDVALLELGWRDALALHPQTAVSVLFERQGAADATSSALDDVLCSGLGRLSPEATAVVLPTPGRWDAPGQFVDGSLSVRGLGTAALADRETVLVVARSDGKEFAVEIPTAALALRHGHGADPRLGLVEVTGDKVTGGTRHELAPYGWSAAVALSRLAVGHELVGAARAMLELAREHALQRIQFGQTISAFQAVRHRLADTLVAIETAGAMLDSAWVDQSPQTAAMAKALAGRGARTATRHCQQVLAGIGFTTEHPLQHYVRRVLVLDQLFGTTLSLTRDLGNELLSTRQLMPLPPL
jgi:hypothetical protein